MTNFSTLYLPLLLLYILNSLNAAQNSIENNSQANDVSGLFEEKFIANPAEDCENATIPKISSTTEAPLPPVVERIEVRLVEGENTTQETPLIIVDVVKKNGSGVAATIQQQHESLDAKEPKPSLGFLVRLKQPNYHSVSYIPYEPATTSSSTTTEVPQAEERVTESTEASTTTITMGSEKEKEKEEEQPAISTTPNSINSSQSDEEADEGIGEMIQFVSIGKIEEEQVLKENKAEEEMEEFDGKEKEEEEEEEEDGGAPPSSEEEQPEHDEEDEREEETILMESVEELNGTDLGDGQELEDMGGRSQQNISEFGDEPHGEEGEGFDPVGDDRAEEMAERDESSEECLANRANLAKEAVKRLVAERRRIVQAIKKMNKHQMLLCRPDREQNQVPYRKCPMWRREKFFLYYALMRITYCDNHARWPGGRRFRAV